MARNSLKNLCRLIDSVTEKLPPEQSFLTDLKRSMEMTEEKHQGKPSQTYKPSSMNCIRGMYYQRVGAEPDIEPTSYSMIGICNSGSDTHIRVQQAVEAMKDNGMDCEYIDVADYIKSRGLTNITVVDKHGMETKLFYEKLSMSFMCDGIIKYRNHYYILEIKTEASFKWQNRTSVDTKHYNQGTAYSVALEIPEVLFVYVNRDIFDMKAYLFVPTDDAKQNLIGTITNCEGYVSRMIPPPKPEDVLKTACKYCSYKTQCRKDG